VAALAHLAIDLTPPAPAAENLGVGLRRRRRKTTWQIYSETEKMLPALSVLGVHQPPNGWFIKILRALMGSRLRMFQQSLRGLRLQQKNSASINNPAGRLSEVATRLRVLLQALMGSTLLKFRRALHLLKSLRAVFVRGISLLLLSSFAPARPGVATLPHG
jgi:hypothetical protein